MITANNMYFNTVTHYYCATKVQYKKSKDSLPDLSLQPFACQKWNDHNPYLSIRANTININIVVTTYTHALTHTHTHTP